MGNHSQIRIAITFGYPELAASWNPLSPPLLQRTIKIMLTNGHTAAGSEPRLFMSHATRVSFIKGGVLVGVVCLIALGPYFSDQSCSNPLYVTFNTWCSAPR